MLAPLVTPFMITVTVLLIVNLCAPPVCLRCGIVARFPRVFVLLASIAGFAPVFIAVVYVTDCFRYGEFHYVTAHDVNDKYIILPDTAREITIHKYAGCYLAKYAISEGELHSWMGELSTRYPLFHIENNPEERSIAVNTGKDFELVFEEVGWKSSGEVVRYVGPSSDYGTRVDVWYDTRLKMAFMRLGYR